MDSVQCGSVRILQLCSILQTPEWQASFLWVTISCFTGLIRSPLVFLLVFSPDHKSFLGLQGELGRWPYSMFTYPPTPIKGQAGCREITRTPLLSECGYRHMVVKCAASKGRLLSPSPDPSFLLVIQSSILLTHGPSFLPPLSLGLSSFAYKTLHIIHSGKRDYWHAYHP